jgi:hypothetical protein
MASLNRVLLALEAGGVTDIIWLDSHGIPGDTVLQEQ